MYMGNSDKAEDVYLKEDRLDLAVTMRMRLGDWGNIIRYSAAADRLKKRKEMKKKGNKQKQKGK